MAAQLIVRHGAMRFLGEFDPEAGTYRRGDDVVVRTDPGLELGHVVCEASPKALAYLEEPTKGRVLRTLTDKDREEQARIRQLELAELDSCVRYVQQRKLQMEPIDVEHLFGGERIVFYFLAEKRVDF